MGERFLRTARLLKRAEFDAVFAAQTKRSSDWLIAHCLANPVGHARLGFAISGKAVSSAVARNRIKRRVREQFRLSATSLPAFDLVIRAKPGIARLEISALNTDIAKLLQRIESVKLQGSISNIPANPKPPFPTVEE